MTALKDGSSTHLSDPRTFDESDDGFFTALCYCGWERGPLPDIETMVDALMEHAFYAGANTATGRPVDTGAST